jgi:uncharacterized membrane protein YdbT with pleckstrin-like domain
MGNPAILESNEKILWEGTPRFISFLLSFDGGHWSVYNPKRENLPFLLAIFKAILYIAFIFLAFFVGLQFLYPINFSSLLNSILYFISTDTLWALFLLVLVIALTTNFVLFYRNSHYFFTNKRIIIQEGPLKLKYKSLDYDNVSDISLNTGWIFDRIFHTGTITIIRKGSKYSPDRVSPYIFSLRHIRDSKVAMEKLKNIIAKLTTSPK